MLTAFALWLPFEMFHGIRDIHALPLNSCFSQSLVQDFTGWSDKGMSGPVLLVARLLADEHDRRMG